MGDHHNRLSWLCENIEQQLARTDRVLAEIVSVSLDAEEINVGEPWLERLLKHRCELRSTLAEIESQIRAVRC